MAPLRKTESNADAEAPEPLVDGAPPAVEPEPDAPASTEAASVADEPAAPAVTADTIGTVSEQPDTTTEPAGDVESAADAAARSAADAQARTEALQAQRDPEPDPGDDTPSKD